MNYKSERYSAVVESGSCSTDRKRFEERRNCGHAHKTLEAAERCGATHYGAHYTNGSWQACADWYGYTIHNQNEERAYL